jgi:N-acetylmuramoyl-L-alanine amidase
MGFEIRNGRLLGAQFVNANASGGTLRPTLIILHDTAGRLEKGSSVSWFKSKDCKVSAHVVVERDGAIVQMVPFNKRAWHAGQSEWQGKKLCNSFAIGIEIVSPGKLDENGRAWFHKDSKGRPLEVGFSRADIEYAATKEHGAGWWLPYTPAQVAAVKELCRALVAAYPDVNDIATHWQVSPGRKIDPAPIFPLEEVEDYAFGRVQPETLEEPPVATVPASEKPLETMAQSSEGNAAVATGGLSTVQISQEVSVAMTKVAATGKGFSVGEFLLQLTTSVTFWMAVTALALSAYLWLRRRHRLVTQGV